MADQKITELPVGTPSPDDLLVLVDDVATAPATKKATVAAVLALATGAEEVAVSPTEPTDPGIELWVDSDEPAPAGGGGGWPLVPLVPFSVASWTWFNQGAATVSESSGVVYLSLPAAAGENIRGKTKALPAGTPTITTALMANPVWEKNYAMAGLVLQESSTQKLVGLTLYGGGVNRAIQVRRNTSPTVAGSVLDTPNLGFVPMIFYFRVAITATQYTLSYSFDGVNFVPHVTENKTAWFTTGPDRVGLMVYNAISPSVTVGASYLSWVET